MVSIRPSKSIRDSDQVGQPRLRILRSSFLLKAIFFAGNETFLALVDFLTFTALAPIRLAFQ